MVRAHPVAPRRAARPIVGETDRIGEKKKRSRVMIPSPDKTFVWRPGRLGLFGTNEQTIRAFKLCLVFIHRHIFTSFVYNTRRVDSRITGCIRACACKYRKYKVCRLLLDASINFTQHHSGPSLYPY